VNGACYSFGAPTTPQLRRELHLGKSCFVIMPIGDQKLVTGNLSSDELSTRYSDLIKEALLRARPNLEVVRADEVSAPGGITTDILTRLMYSDYVVADITYPNPNVFYELGIRHACRSGTILIRELNAPQAPFDLFDSRHIAYENTPHGLKILANRLKAQFDWIDEHLSQPDNRFMELAKLTRFHFPMYQRLGYPATIESAIDEQLYSLCFFKERVLFDILVNDCRHDELEFITELSYLVTNRTTEPHHWKMQKKFKYQSGKALEVRFNDNVIDPEILDYKYGRGINVPQRIEPGETASVFFKIKEQFRLSDFDLYTSYHPATDLRLVVNNPYKNVLFDFEIFYFTDVAPQSNGDRIEICFDKGLLPHQGVRLNWKGV